MAKYEVTMRCSFITYFIVDANTTEEAIERADEWDGIDQCDFDMGRVRREIVGEPKLVY